MMLSILSLGLLIFPNEFYDQLVSFGVKKSSWDFDGDLFN